ncbi:MAG: carboxypeptidase regulatory-like domain-containing protein [Planctomycetota bacterium]|nr:carboxypeptidase regulatory-like domain-containing protein [Planctomycetota bacterium]
MQIVDAVTERPIEGSSLIVEGGAGDAVAALEAGKFRVSGDPVPRMKASASGYESLDLGPAPLENVPLRIALEPLGEVDVWIVSAGGDAVVGAGVRIKARVGTTDRHGRVALDGLPLGQELVVQVDAAQGVPLEAPRIRLSHDRRRVRLDIVLHPKDALLLLVLEESGAPVSGAYLFFQSNDGGRPYRKVEAKTGAGGRARIDGLTDRFYRLVIVHPEFEPFVLRRIAGADAPREERVTLQRKRSHWIEGVVIRAGAETPVAGVKVRVGGRPDGPHAITDAAGRFRIEGLKTPVPAMGFPRARSAPGVAVHLEGKEIVAPDYRVHLDAECRLIVSDAGRVVGRVLDENREPVLNYFLSFAPHLPGVRLEGADGVHTAWQRDGSFRRRGAGWFEGRRVMACRGTLRVHTSGRRPTLELEIDVRPGRTLDLGELVLGRGGTLEIALRNSGSDDIEGSNGAVYLVDGDGRVPPQGASQMAGSTVALSAVPPGEYTAMARMPGFVCVPRGVLVKSAETSELEITMLRASSIRIEPRANQGEAWRVSLRYDGAYETAYRTRTARSWADDHSVHRFTSSDDKHLVMDVEEGLLIGDLPPGRYDLEFERPSEVKRTVSVSLDEGQDVVIQFPVR